MHHLFVALQHYFTRSIQSPFASGGLFLMIFGGAAAVLKSIPGRIAGRLRDRVTTTVTIREVDPLFDWLCYWMSQQPYAGKCRSLLAITRRERTRSDCPAQIATTPCDVDAPLIHLTPAYGLHAFRWGTVWVLIDRNKQNNAGQNGLNIGEILSSGHDFLKTETITLTFFTTNRAAVMALLEDARQLANPPGEVKTKVYISRGYGGWDAASELPCREPESIVLPAGEYERISDDLQAFFANVAFYRRVGMPHRRGYLLQGPPGSGKTSLIRALAGEMRCGLHVLNLAETGLTDSSLMSLLAGTRDDRAFIVIEDIDSYFDGRQPRSPELKVSFSGLLNAIDGAAASEGRVLFLTTNHREGLDPALIRPGRVDFEMAFGYADDDQIDRLYYRFHPHGTELGLLAYRDELSKAFTGPVTAAQVQGFLYAGCARDLKQLAAA